MAFFLEQIRTAYKTAYMNPKGYIEAKIYHGGKSFDIKKRWYVYYSFVDDDGKMKRQTPITLEVNRRFKTRRERMYHLRLIRDIINDLLKRGATPNNVKALSKNYTAEGCLTMRCRSKKVR